MMLGILNHIPENKGDDYNFCEDHKVDIVFEPSAEEIYPKDHQLILNSSLSKYFM